MGEWHVHPLSWGFALLAHQHTELGFDSSSGDSVRDQNEHSYLCFPSQGYLCGIRAGTYAGNCKHLLYAK